MIRVIAGKHRGRPIETIEHKTLRPTLARIRESIFNVIAHGHYTEDGSSILNDAIVLDLFCGTGALGIESLSRGAKQVIFMDKNQKHLDLTAYNLEYLSEQQNAIIIRGDSSNPPPAQVKCNVVLLDPPYDKKLITPTLRNVAAAGWITEGGIVMIERSDREHYDIPEGFEVVTEKKYGKICIDILQCKG